jgi:anti-sigma-K factor RskA
VTHEQILELLPIHALDALEGDQLAEVDAHVSNCEVCSTELSTFYSVTATLTSDVPAPLGVWDRIEAEIEGESSSAKVISLEEASSRKGKGAMWFASIAAAAALIFAGLAVFQRGTINDLSGPEGVIVAAESAAEEPGAIVADFETDDGSVAQVVLSPDGEGFVLPADSLDPLDEDRTYQLWVITPDEQVISAGVLGNDPEPARFTWSGEVAGFALTRERAGGVISSEGDVVSVIEA